MDVIVERFQRRKIVQKVCESTGFTDVVLCTPEIGHSESDGHQQAGGCHRSELLAHCRRREACH